MKLPMDDNVVDVEFCKKMVDELMQVGFIYFDTRGYIKCSQREQQPQHLRIRDYLVEVTKHFEGE